ncbi:hypothetical protein AAG570_012813 [Ranatra chinensis]|uniref:Pentatricopeptide repeat-containing protein 2 n=1 Tax=Ranatra chinensis TaxID=642074 RepID=A0ABD0Z372_9HEMI
MGIDNYIKTREKVKMQFHDIEDKFKSKMKDFIRPSSSSMIFTEDLKHIVHLAELDDLDLVQAMMVKFSQQNKELRFGSFVFGPVVMRMYHYLNKPIEALAAFRNSEMDNFFDQLISFQILMDLLLKNNMYDEVLEVFDIVKNKQLQGAKYPKNAVVLALAACYKLNTPESFEYAKRLWSELNEVGHYPMRRAATFAAALALKQNSPHIALEILTSMRQQTYVTIRNLKVAALADLGRPDDALPILRSVLETDESSPEKRSTFSAEIVSPISSTIFSIRSM